MVDVLGTVVGVEGADGEGEGADELFQDGEQEVLTDTFDCGDELELGDLVDGVDEVHPFDPVRVALVDAVDAQIAGLAVGTGFAAFADGDLHRTGLIDGAPLTPVALGSPQVVEMAIRNRGQAFVAAIAEDLEGTLAQLLSGRSREVAVESVQFGQELDVQGGEAPDEGFAGLAATILDTAGAAELIDQASQLLAREATDLDQVAHHQPSAGPVQAVVA